MSTGPRRLGKYELQKRLAHGGMGEVWKTHDTQLNRYVAIKLLRTDVQDNPEFATRFEQEARFIAALRHPNIVQIHDFSISEPPESEIPTAYIVMDFVEGQTLADYIRSTSKKGNFPPTSDLIYIFTAISSALDYAHREGKIHRDIKPANILLDQRLPSARSMGEPILIDFGIARLQGVATGTAVGSLLGTPLYISPEQAQGLHGDHRSDLYSLGIILYEMMTGVTPFRGDTTMAILVQHLNDAPTPPEFINPSISPELSAIILKTIAKKADDRFPTASAMTIALAQALHVPVPARLLPSSDRLPPSSSQGQPYVSPSRPSGSYIPNTPTPVRDPIQAPMGNFQASPVTPPDLLPNTSLAPPSSGQEYRYESTYMQGWQIPQQAGQPQSKQPGKNRWLLLTLALVLLVGLVGAGFWAFVLPAQNGSSTGGGSVVVGQLQFSHSPQATNNAYDQLQITLQNIPDPPDGRTYYAWIQAPANETEAPHWKLNVQNGNIQQTVTYPKNLLIANALFIVTAEDSRTPPIIAYTGHDQRFFYARITSTATQTFTVQKCPEDPSSQACVG
jgi:eukaryotic-like serine/threonine-protein kinase